MIVVWVFLAVVLLGVGLFAWHVATSPKLRRFFVSKFYEGFDRFDRMNDA